jgi:8-oxo-dGTP pyrophosphatase MutT (NUDIX family)
MTNIEIDKLKSLLPEYPGILGKEEYFNSAVLIPLVKINDEYHFLFEKRAENIRQGGEICFPGGEYDTEIDTNYIDTAIRETEEEIGIPAGKINVLGILDTLIGPRGITVDSCIAEVSIDSINECRIDETEVAKVFTVPVKFFMATEPETYKIVSAITHTFYNPAGEIENLVPLQKKSTNQHIDQSYTKAERNVLVYKTSGEIIWGITARLVYEVIKKLSS